MGGLTRNTPWDDQSSGGWLKKHLFTIKTLSLIVLSVQTSTMVLLLRYSRTSTTSNQAPYIITTAVLLSEILKLGLSLGFLHIEAGNIPAKDLNNSHILLGDSRQTSQSITLALFMFPYAWSFSCTG